ncbi:methylmalonyl-CoA mutase family protein [Flavobacterium sp.]|uniref:methylmalonyl-CoA mutase family protein n=1 Tax=Flavobacterium sp. TaxID=239 RepID=UPI00260C6EE2|nr:methylmalonyl-CoA mutase family protein [Flavobacterium sp.]
MSDIKSQFSAFENVSAAKWKQQIQFELKGADYNETVVRHASDGIKVKPFYNAEDRATHLPAVPKTAAFKITETLYVKNVDKTIQRATKLVAKGCEAIILDLPERITDFQMTFSALLALQIPIFLRPQFYDEIFFAAVSKIEGVTLLIDPIHELAATGNWFSGSDKQFGFLNQTPTIYINAGVYHNAGATPVQTIAFALAHAVEYFNQQSKPKDVVFQLELGSDYFFEIAAIRALRLLYQTVANSFGITAKCSLIAIPGKRNKTIYDYNVNMLRTTTECMSAILGGADFIQNRLYDALYHKENEFGNRIARNQLLILKHEAHLDKVQNPCDGSYFIESLTAQMARLALEKLKQIEADGGFIASLKKERIQAQIKLQADAEQQAVDAGKHVLIGTNKFKNSADVMNDQLELYPFLKVQARKTIIAPLIQKRLAENIEQERLKSEKSTL